MNTEELRSYYQHKIVAAEERLNALRRRINSIATGRLLLFAAVIILAIVLYRQDMGWGAIVADILLGGLLFFALMQRHDKVFKQKEFEASLLRILQEELLRLEGHEEGLASGEAFRNQEHPYTADLDIFGPGSIFQYINRSGTVMGRRRLAQWLSRAADGPTIQARQTSIRELSVLDEWRQHFQARNGVLKEDIKEYKDLGEWLNQPSYFLPNKFLAVFIRIMPFITIAVWILTLWWLPVKLAMFISALQLGIVGQYTKRINKEHSLTAKKYGLLEKYAALIESIEGQAWNSEEMQQLKSRFSGSQGGAAASLKRLGKVVASLDSRLNLLGTIIANGLYMRDLHNIYALERWKERYRAEVPDWFEALADADALVSLSTFAFNHAAFAYPQLRESDFYLSAKALGHPLIPTEKRVDNDLAIDGWGQVMLITGSNMGGKSTFLRAVGVNMVLAMAGAPVCAREFVITPVQLFSSMRVGDSIRNSESTFYAELKRLKTIIDRLSAGEKLFVLLDEILRGTNSADKLTGSEAFLKQLMALQGSGIVATHDLALAKLETEYPAQLHNYNFEVQITGEHFDFDYKLKRGVCKTLNATLLMKKMGIRM